MGGHGGLNILPQKSWNVYGRENRLKVARDEAKHAEEQREKLEKQRLAESEARRAVLLQQAAQKRLSTDPGPSAETAQLPEPEQQQAPALLQHINFFEEHEARDAHPEVAEEARKEARRRGDEKTQTSDARFDERFQFGHGLGGARNSASQPWYAQAKAPLLPQDDVTGALRLEDDGRPLTLNGHDARVTERNGPLLIEGIGHKRLDKVKSSKTDKKEKHKKKSRHKEDRKQEGKKKTLDIERLRQERLQREKQERERARQAIMGNVSSLEGGKRYHGAYGNAPVSQRTN
ncbi:g4774 [Coccomyxa elongata]